MFSSFSLPQTTAHLWVGISFLRISLVEFSVLHVLKHNKEVLKVIRKEMNLENMGKRLGERWLVPHHALLVSFGRPTADHAHKKSVIYR